MNITVRELRDSDVEPLSMIEAASFSMPWSAQDFRDLLSRDYCLYVVAEADGEVAGCAGLTNCCNEGNIDNVVVAERFRGQGIARRMLTDLLAGAEEKGMEAFTLEVRVSNEPAIRLYHHLGFEDAGIRKGFYSKPLEDALIMWKYNNRTERI